MGRWATTLVAALVGVAGYGCTGRYSPSVEVVAPTMPGPIQVFGPACAGVRSCLMGHVVAAESMAPLARATIFLERTSAPEASTAAELSAHVHFVRITDEEGVFAVADAPAGLYRLAVYKESRNTELQGIHLGAPGTTMVPVRLPKG